MKSESKQTTTDLDRQLDRLETVASDLEQQWQRLAERLTRLEAERNQQEQKQEQKQKAVRS